MSRPLRLEYAGALYHVTSRGDRQENIYEGDADRRLFLAVFGDVCSHYNWTCHAYCLMSNHYHLVIETPEANLSKGMRQLNGEYTRQFNRSTRRVGHVFQGRYKAIHVEKEVYLLELSRYVVLNPVRAHMVREAGDWPWSNYRATIGQTIAPTWLNTEWVLASFDTKLSRAIKGYQLFVQMGKEQASPWSEIKNQVFLGSKEYVEKLHARIDCDKDLSEIPSSQRRPMPLKLSEYERTSSSRNAAIVSSYKGGGYSLKEIGEYFNLHYSRVSKIVKEAKGKT